jgi:hypothetical protein
VAVQKAIQEVLTTLEQLRTKLMNTKLTLVTESIEEADKGTESCRSAVRDPVSASLFCCHCCVICTVTL